MVYYVMQALIFTFPLIFLVPQLSVLIFDGKTCLSHLFERKLFPRTRRCSTSGPPERIRDSVYLIVPSDFCRFIKQKLFHQMTFYFILLGPQIFRPSVVSAGCLFILFHNSQLSSKVCQRLSHLKVTLFFEASFQG